MSTYKEEVFDAIRKRNWVSSETIKEVGGSDGLRRLGELREEGYDIKDRRTSEGTKEFRLVSHKKVFGSYQDYQF